MIKLLSIGDKLAPARYRVHSRFSRAVNFEFEEELATLVDEEIDPGPINIVIRGIDLGAIQLLEIDDTFIRLDGCRIGYDDCERFQSDLVFLENPIPNRIFNNLLEFEKALIAYAPPKSLAFLIDPKRNANFRTSFEVEFAKRIENGVKSIREHDMEIGVRTLRGVGFGLTPSGDDFIAGMIIAYKLGEKLMGIDFSNQIETIYTNAISQNLVSNAFLRCAKEGALSERQKKLITALLFQIEAEMVKQTKILMEIGETSGADWGVGFLMTMKRIFN